MSIRRSNWLMACLEEAAVEEEAHRAVDSDVVVDARPYVEELWEI
jgi:hypothetical protein